LEHSDLDIDIEGARFVVQGFGAVGKHTARFLTDRGAVLVGVADSAGAIHNPDGLDLNQLMTLKAAGQSVADYPGAQALERDAVIDIDCGIWIPAARPDVVNENNVDRLKTKLVVEGANIPLTEAAEIVLHRRGVLVDPDFIANAGGVICAAMEYRGATESAVMETIAEKVRRNTKLVLDTAMREQMLPRRAATAMAEQRVRKAMGFRLASSHANHWPMPLVTKSARWASKQSRVISMPPSRATTPPNYAPAWYAKAVTQPWTTTSRRIGSDCPRNKPTFPPRSSTPRPLRCS